MTAGRPFAQLLALWSVVLIGGDIVYDNGEPDRVSRWFHLLP